MGTIRLKNIKIYAFHGCLMEEGQIGSDYLVNLSVGADLKNASNTDELGDTINYVHLQKIVKDQMAVRSKLLENVCGRIITTVFEEIPSANLVRISVSKVNPPIGGDVDEVSVTMQARR